MKIKIITITGSCNFPNIVKDLEEKVNEFTQTKGIIVHKIKIKKDFTTAAIYYKESDFK